ncbi:DUF2975 domain-containing protein [Sphingomonas sp.]|uniref:DUF2975 domain-containing protein n=1 Tax=Sphingomonas sp. TaxID=28214 RepID=UPI0031DB9B06
MAAVKDRDPLLAITQLILRILIAIMGLLIAAGLVAVAALLLVPGQQFAPALTDASRGTVWWVTMGAAMLIAILALGIAFTLNLTRIIATVGHDDPFRPENADRLARMAWLTLVAQLCGLILVPIVRVIASHIGEGRPDFGPSFDGFILALVLFILARVFRRGTQMRDDLEGTV